MQKLLKELYRFSSENQVSLYLRREKESLDDSIQMYSSATDTLRDSLSPEQWRCFEDYVLGRNICADIHSEAYFFSGLAMGLALGRLSV